ncbi:MAG: HEAT repeat domain-containing protein [Gemmatimonadales bacterium]|nr:HEAT repeat domain-containing protein [Gemmatimonadales bacterium]
MSLVPLFLAVVTFTAQDPGPLMASRAPEPAALEYGDAQDPGDSLYRAARQALNRDQYARAAEMFRSLRQRYPRSSYVGDSHYWEAFALYRTGSADDLRTARTALETQRQRHPNATTRRDAEVLLRRIQGELARRGDAQAAEAIAQAVDPIAPVPTVAPVPPRTPSAPRPPRSGRSSGCDDDDDMRIAALNAVLQMDADRAVPLLKTVLARRDSGSTCLRRKAVFLVSQKRSPETSAILLDAVRSDPDQEVREQAVFWLSQVPGEEAVTALDSVLRSSRDAAVQEKAIFALSQHRSERAGAILRGYVERRDAPGHLREQAIFWLSQHRSAENQAFLRNLYPRLDSPELKEKVLFSVSQMRGEDNARWLLDIALNEREDIELRKKALFWAGQSRATPMADFVALYDRVRDREIKEQLIFVFSQRREGPALDKLFAIARTEPDRELRKKAIFWIGQSRDPRAAQFLQELINQ